ncbi:MAG: ATP-binding protein [Actinomycetota bacterium]
MVAARHQGLEDARRLERGMATVRWVAVVFGVLQVWQSTHLAPVPPRGVVHRAILLMVLLGVANVVITIAAGRMTRLRRLRLVGATAFGLDIAVVTALIWNYQQWATGTTWAAGYVLMLEGALRYRLNGALAASGIFAISEALREWHLTLMDPGYQADVAAVTFRVGVGALIALVAGVMARSLASEAGKADDRAVLAEAAAQREADARREVALFHSAVLAGVAAEDLDDAMQSMAEAIGRDLGFEICAILLRDDDGSLRSAGCYGVPETTETERTFHLGHGLVGSVIATGRPLLARDVGALTELVVLDPRVKAAAAVPLRVDGEVIGAIDVETWGHFQTPEATLDLLTRLADQVALVVHSARLQARQKEMLDRMSELDRMKSDFVAITSHELRTPLTAIRGFVKTMLHNGDRLSAADMKDFLLIVDRQSHRLARLVEDLLMASKIEAGELSIAPEAVAPVVFLGNLIASFGENAGRVELRVEGDIPQTIVIDPYRLEQVLRNLIHNAMKFSEDGSPITLSVGFDARRMRLRVRDRGTGIAPEEQGRIFERFHQAGAAMTRETEGAGLGLYITKRLIEAMDGTIELQSVVGKGSTFTIRLPLDATLSEPEPPVDRGEEGEGGEEKVAVPLERA